MSNITDTTTRPYLPIPWTVTSLNPSAHTCPSPSSLLGTFAIVNGMVSLLAVLFGHRHVVKKLTCGCFGKRSSQSWKIMWVIPVGLQLAANACIALLIQRTDGYAASFKITDLMLWLIARPRLSWIILGGFAFQKRAGKRYPHEKDRTGSTAKLNANTSYEELRESPYASSPNPEYFDSQWSLANSYNHVSADESDTKEFIHDYPWWSAFMTQFIAEFVLQIMALYVMGRTAHYGAARNYYKIYLSTYWDIPSSARMMYSGALYYLVAGSLFLIFAFFFIMYQMLSSKVKTLGKGNTMAIMVSLWFLLISTWLGSWLFWAGFVKLAGDL
jgi:hypothetical protein